MNNLNLVALRKGAALAITLLLCACQTGREDLSAKRVSFSDVPGFREDNLTEAAVTMQRSCVVMQRTPDKSYPLPLGVNLSGTYSDWGPFCNSIEKDSFLGSHNKVVHNKRLHKIFKTHLTPYALSIKDNKTAHITGYYEPLLHGSLKRHGRFQTPLYRYPSAGEITRKKINIKQPRAAIIAGALKGKGLELVYVDSPIDAFFLQIQGSGRVKLDNGKIMRLGFAEQNKHAYHPIGKTLIENGELAKKDTNMQTIRAWLSKHPKKAEAIMSTNPSYVFFRVLPADTTSHGPTDGPIGSQGVKLTAQRSLAVDPKYIVTGAPLWLHTDQHTINHLVVAQDTGGAIKGGLRADYFWGFGNAAAAKAGRMNSTGAMYLFLPKSE